MEVLEMIRKLKRLVDSNFTYRRALMVLIFIFVLFIYVGPNFLRWLYSSKPNIDETSEKCLSEGLENVFDDAYEYNSNVVHIPQTVGDIQYLSYVGNGVFGLSINSDSPIYIRNGRTLSLPVTWYPIISAKSSNNPLYEGIVVSYTTGIAHRVQCFGSGIQVAHEYYAHRTMPGLFVQEINFKNPSSELYVFDLHHLRLSNWNTAVSQIVLFPNGKDSEYEVTTGMVEVPTSESTNVIAVSIVSRKIPRTLEVKPRSSTSISFFTTISYSDPVTKLEYATKKDEVEKKAMKIMERALVKRNLKDDHIDVWQQLWSTGVTISHSKHSEAVNGDKINATFYYVLSQVTSPYHEEGTSKERKAELMNTLFYAEGCYAGYHTLQAENLWRDLSSIEEVNKAVKYWLLTLDKQGCHNLIKAGASGVMQAMVLSIGSLRFSNHHLEFNMHPSYLHRDFLFRRISYGNLTHVNISVQIQENNKAVLYVALDRSDKYYYACGGGCLDAPALLGPQKKEIQVKLTEPVTAILYITYDKQHMEDLRHALHLKSIVDAPPLHHHIIALHKHGHHLGGLPTMFWVLIGCGIVLFHAFLFKLIYNEICGVPDKIAPKTRYGRIPTDVNNMHRL